MAEGTPPKNYERMPGLGRGGGGAQRFAPGAKPKNARKTLSRLLGIFLERRLALAAAAGLTVVSCCIALAAPLLLGMAVNTLHMETGLVDTPLLHIILLALVLCHLLHTATDIINGILMAKVTQQLVRLIRNRLFEKLLRLPLQFFDTSPHGDTMSRITNDVDNISMTVAQTTTQLTASVFSILGALVMMLILSPLLTAAAMISVPLFLLLTHTITRRSRRYFLAQQQSLGALGSVVEENITGLQMVKACNRREKVLADFRVKNRALCRYATKAQIWAGFMMPFMNVINNLSFALIAGIGGLLVLRDIVTVGVVVSSLSYSRQFGHPLNNIAGMFNNIQAALAGAERIFEIMDEREETADAPEAAPLTQVRGRVEFRNVYFAYTEGVPVLGGVSFAAEPGDVVALVGETGAGKTTVVNLLNRFFEPDGGEILIDGVEIRNITRESFRRVFSVVLQDTCLFSGTIADNIRYGKPDATDAEVRCAAELAHADRFITRLPGGYDFCVSGGADRLSQGQRQLLAIARAILCGAPILILDEATSSVDTKTEKDIQQAMLTLIRNRTSFLIAHRLSTIRDADKILVIGEGRILEQGTHCELMARKGPYRTMVESQLGNDA